MTFAELIRHIGLGIVAFIIGMNVYTLFRVHSSRKILIHERIKSFKKMTFSIEWLLLNQCLLFAMVFLSRYQRLIAEMPLTWIDWAGIPLFISYTLWNMYIVKHYILAAMNGKLFSKDEIPRMNWE